MPNCHPRKYSSKVKEPSVPIVAARRRTAWPKCRTDSTDRKASARPHNSRPKAVLAFMVAMPGKTLFRAAMLNSQPHRTAHPKNIRRELDKNANFREVIFGADLVNEQAR